MNSLGERQKSYELNEKFEKGAVIIRVDGRSFHTWTKKIDAAKPFDPIIPNALGFAAYHVASDMQGFRLAYIQSDECTFVIANPGEKEGAWFDYKVQKLASVTASMFTYHFNTYYMLEGFQYGYGLHPAFFDTRAFSVPIEDVANNIVWRQQDWYRNSVQLLGQSLFSHKELLNKSCEEIRAMVASKGIYWDEMPEWQKYGQFLVGKSDTYVTGKFSYSELNEMMGFDVTNKD